VLPIEQFEQVLTDARPLGLETIKLTGGEPLMHPRIIEMLEITARAGLKVNIETNGLLCTPQIARLIAAIKQPFVSVSLDADHAQIHDWMRGVPGAFDKACAAVRCLSAAGIDTQIVMTIVRRNMTRVQGMIALAEQLGASSVKFNLVQPTARGLRLQEQGETPSVRELIELGKLVTMKWRFRRASGSFTTFRRLSGRLAGLLSPNPVAGF
jgi:SynChlorMet cassette radical SAM/SPASM protein ScmF